MMNPYILIILMMGSLDGGVAVQQIEFSTQGRCVEAEHGIKKQYQSYRYGQILITACVQK